MNENVSQVSVCVVSKQELTRPACFAVFVSRVCLQGVSFAFACWLMMNIRFLIGFGDFSRHPVRLTQCFTHAFFIVEKVTVVKASG